MSGIEGYAARAAAVVERIGPGEAGEPTSSVSIDRIADELVMAHFTPSATLDMRTISRTLAQLADTVAAEAGVPPSEVHCATSHPDDGWPFTYMLVATIQQGGGQSREGR